MSTWWPTPPSKSVATPVPWVAQRAGVTPATLKVVASAGAEANFFGFSATTGSSTLFSRDFLAS